MDETTIKFECANCGLTQDISENIALIRLNEEAIEFYKSHKKIYHGTECRRENLFIRTFKA